MPLFSVASWFQHRGPDPALDQKAQPSGARDGVNNNKLTLTYNSLPNGVVALSYCRSGYFLDVLRVLAI